MGLFRLPRGRNLQVGLAIALLIISGLIAHAFAQQPEAAAPSVPALPAAPPALDPMSVATPTPQQEKAIADQLGVAPPSPSPLLAARAQVEPATPAPLPATPPGGDQPDLPALPPAPPLLAPGALPPPAPIGTAEKKEAGTPAPNPKKATAPAVDVPEPAPLKSAAPLVQPKDNAVPPPPLPSAPEKEAQPPAFQPLGSAAKPDTALPAVPQPHDPKVEHAGTGPQELPKSLANNLPSVVVDKTGPSSARVGEVLKFEIVVRNVGNAAASNLLVSDVIPAHAEVVDTAPPADKHNQHLTWKVDGLAPGKEQRFTVKLKPMRTGDLGLEAAAVIQIAQKQLTMKILERPLVLDVPPAVPVNVGQKVHLKIGLTNKGDQAQVGLLLNLSVPDGLKHPAGKDIVADLPPIPAGETKVIDVKLDTVKSGKYPLSVAVGIPGGDNLKKDLSVEVQESVGLVLKKIGHPALVRGKVNEYRVEVINQGANEAQHVILTESLPEGLDFVEASDNGVYNPKNRTVQWIVGNVRPGHTKAVGLRIVGQQVGEVVNQVTAQASGGLRVDLTARLQIQPPAPAAPGPFGILK